MTPLPAQSARAHRVAVTGAHGKLGRIVVGELLEHGLAVVAIDRSTATDRDARAIERVADLADSTAAAWALEGCDALIHLAAITDPVSQPAPTMFLNNLASTFNVLSAAVHHRLTRVVLASSQSVLGHPWASTVLPLDYVPVDEAHPVRPVDPYALSKQLGEVVADYFARAHGLRVLSFRLSSVWLPEQFPWRPTVRLTETEQAAKSMWAYVDVRDAARACRLATDTLWRGHKVLNVTSRWAIGNKPVPELLAEWYPATTDIRVPLHACTPVFDWHKAEGLLGFRARYRWLPEGIVDMGVGPLDDA